LQQCEKFEIRKIKDTEEESVKSLQSWSQQFLQREKVVDVQEKAEKFLLNLGNELSQLRSPKKFKSQFSFPN